MQLKNSCELRWIRLLQNWVSEVQSTRRCPLWRIRLERTPLPEEEPNEEIALTRIQAIFFRGSLFVGFASWWYHRQVVIRNCSPTTSLKFLMRNLWSWVLLSWFNWTLQLLCWFELSKFLWSWWVLKWRNPQSLNVHWTMDKTYYG